MEDVIPDVYQFAVSVANPEFQGVCRLNGTAKKTCVGHFPGSLNLTEAVIQDIDNFKHCEPWAWDETLEQDCKDRITKHVDNEGAKSLDRLMVVFLVLSIVINAISFYILIRVGNIFHVGVTLILGFDTMLLFTSFAFCFMVMSYEVGPYVEDIPLQKFSETQMIGPGFWALFGILMMRMATAPILLWGIVPLLIPMVGVFYYLVLMKGFFTLVRTAVLVDLTRMPTT
ncbi:NADH oxidase [Fusarium mexicanum]|uniref:NADH oxidase n=1 Tax=Fusarium mexicanum TaxID=751941 RepID=A0A8H5MV36_9HYPO|nr:NADH oxidase [Fusarium mexicanum]